LIRSVPLSKRGADLAVVESCRRHYAEATIRKVTTSGTTGQIRLGIAQET
jgi:hypothetical protein